jgi:hypothetical protein
VLAETTSSNYGVPMTAGDIYTVAGHSVGFGFSGDGGAATNAELTQPNGLAVNAAGNLLISDSYNERIRIVTG